MNVTKTWIALAAFVVGCGAGGAASQLVIPSARAGTNPTRWEYTCIRAHDPMVGETDALAAWNRAGAQGWEFTVLLRDEDACFKRILP